MIDTAGATKSPLSYCLGGSVMRRAKDLLFLPYSALAGMRLLCLGLALLSVVAAVPAILVETGSAWLGPAGVAASVLVSGIWVAGYRFGRFRMALEPVEAGCVALAALGAPSHLVLTPLFAVLFRSLYGSAPRAAMRLLLYGGALAIGVEAGEAGPGEPLLGRLIGLTVAAAGMQFIKYLLERQEAGEEGFRLLQGAKDYAVFMLDRGGRVRSWNVAAQGMLGFRPEEVLGRPLAALSLTAEGKPDDSDLAEAAKLGSVQIEGWHARDSGQAVFAEVVLTAIRDHGAKRTPYSVIVRDITERREVGAALEKSRERLREAIGGAPMVLWAVDREGLITLCEGGRLEGLGLAAAEIVGRPVEVLWPEHPELLAGYQRAVRGERVVTTVEREELTFEIRHSPVRDETEEVVGAIGVATDVTARDIAHRLQRSLLPASLPELRDISTAARYFPGAAGAEVGGDWYDVIQLSDAKVGLIVGDVVGRGVRAASFMAKLRTTLFVCAVEVEQPAEVLARVNTLMPRLTSSHIATVVYCVFDPARSEVTFASAGHLPPLIVDERGEAAFAEVNGSLPLGALLLTRYETYKAPLTRGSTLLLYTDGLIERRDQSIRQRLGLLRSVCASAPSEPEPFCDQIVSSMTDGGSIDDDVALLALRVLPTPAERIDLEVPASPESVPLVRDQVRLWLQQNDSDPREAYRVLVACGEACANAIEHAYGPTKGTLRLSGTVSHDVVNLTVEDRGEWRIPRDDDRGRGLGIMKSLMGSVEIESGNRGTRVVLRHSIQGEARDAAARAPANH